MNTRGEILEHSKAKLELYREYLKAYLPILLQSGINDLYIFDVYAGSGYSENQEPGSTVILMDTLKEVLDINTEKIRNRKIAELTFIVNEKKPEYNEKLLDVLLAKKDEIKQEKGYDIGLQIWDLDAKEFLSGVLDFIHQKVNQFNKRYKANFLFFIDPFGYKEITRNLLYNIMRYPRTEVIVFLPINFVTRFKGSQKTLEINTSLKEFLLSFFTEDELKSLGYISEESFIYDIKSRLKFNEKTYTSYYYIEKDKFHNKYVLYFLTHSLKGLEKFIDAKWRVDDIWGAGYRYRKEKPKTQNTQLALFGMTEEYKQELRKEKFKQMVYDYLKCNLFCFLSKNDVYCYGNERVKPIDNINLTLFALEELGISIKILRQILRDLDKEGVLAVENLTDQINQKIFYIGFDKLKETNFKPVQKFKINDTQDKNRMERSCMESFRRMHENQRRL